VLLLTRLFSLSQIGTGVLTDLNVSRGPGSEGEAKGEATTLVAPESAVATSEVKVVSMPGSETPAAEK